MKVCIFGVGGVGGYFGGKIAHFMNENPSLNNQVYFIARGNHLKEIQSNGLVLKQENHATLICRPTLATDNVETIPEMDLFLICIKSYDLEACIHQIESQLTPSTLIIPLLNGVNIYQRIRNITTKGIIFPACVYVGTHIERDGVISQKGGEGKIIFGPDPQNQNANPEQLGQLFQFFQGCGINYAWQSNPYIEIWSKFIFIASYGLVCSVTKKTLGEVFENSQLKTDVETIMQEIRSIASAQHIILPDTIIHDSLTKARNFPHDAKTSFQRDVEVKGKPNEADLFGKDIIELGKANSIPTPMIEKYYHKIVQK